MARKMYEKRKMENTYKKVIAGTIVTSLALQGIPANAVVSNANSNDGNKVAIEEKAQPVDKEEKSIVKDETVKEEVKEEAKTGDEKKVDIKDEVKIVDEKKAEAKEFVNIPDNNFKKALNLAIKKEANEEISDVTSLDLDKDLTKEDLTKITSLNICYIQNDIGEINSIEGIQYCTNLQEFIGREMQNIKDMKLLYNVKSLKKLELIEINQEQLKGIDSLENLDYLNIDCVDLTSLAYLEKLTNLTTLYCVKGNVKDITPIANLKKLEILDLSYNKISDISTIANLENLQELMFECNNIKDVTPLKNLRKLTHVNFNNNNISDLSSINDEMKNLSIKKDSINHFLFGEQEIILDSTNKDYSVDFKSLIKGVEGEGFEISDISEDGVYDENSGIVKWNHPTENNLKFDFKDKKFDFSGTIILPVGTNMRTQIKLGEKFNLEEAVKTFAKENGDEGATIVPFGDVDTNTLGSYEIAYYVISGDGNSVINKRVIDVVDKDGEKADSPKLQLNNDEITVKAGDKIKLSDYIKSAIANDDEEITDNVEYRILGKVQESPIMELKFPTLNAPEGQAANNKAKKEEEITLDEGTYAVEYSVIDNNGVKTTKILNLKVNKDGISTKPAVKPNQSGDKTQQSGNKVDKNNSKTEVNTNKNQKDNSNNAVKKEEKLEATKKLPKTGGVQGELVALLGAIMAALGAVISIKKK